MMRTKIISLAVGVSMLMPLAAFAQNADQVQAQIQALLQQLHALQQQLAQLQGGGQQQWCHTFSINLKVGDSGAETYALIQSLEKDGSLSYGEAGHSPTTPEDAVFTESVASAITGFQEKYRDEILTPNGLKYGTGYVGRATRAKLNQLYGCGRPTSGSLSIFYLQAKAEDKNILHAGENTGIYGSGLSGATTVWIGSRSVAVSGSSDSSLYFIAPSDLSLGMISLSVQNSAGQQSNSINVKVIGSSAGVPSITVLYPNGGENIIKGQPFQITWRTSPDLGSTLISAYIDVQGGFCYLGSANGLKAGMQATLQDTGDCSIANGPHKISLYAGGIPGGESVPIAQDQSDNYFTVAPATIAKPSITVTYPNGGEQISILGKDVDFRTTWTSSNLSGNATVYLSFTSGETCLLGTVPVSQGYFPVSLGSNYKCPNLSRTITTGQYKIFIETDTNPNDNVLGVHDSSDNYFTVTLPINAPIITLIYPKDGYTWYLEDQNFEFDWSTSNFASSPVFVYLQTTDGKYIPVAQGVPNTGSYILPKLIPVVGSVIQAFSPGSYKAVVCGQFQTGTLYSVCSNAASVTISSRAQIPTLPDLAVTSMTIDPPTPIVGKVATLTIVFTNKGGSTASGINFSTDLGYQAVSSTAPGNNCANGMTLVAGTSCSIVLSVIYSGPVAANVVKTIIDIDNMVKESNKSNNTATITFPIGL